MNLDIALNDAQRIYFDTAPLIYWDEAHPDYIAKMDQIIDAIEASPLQAFTSVITLTELISSAIEN